MISQTLIDVGLLVVGIGLLWKGADWVVHSACGLAHHFGLPDAVAGVSIVALGTSAPELTVAVLAALQGHPDLAVANIVGSNIFNLGIILGGCAAIWTVPTTRPLVGRDTPALLLATLLLLLFLDDRLLERWEGVVMVMCLASYLLYLVTRRGLRAETYDPVSEDTGSTRDYFGLILGLAGVLGGAHLLVGSASDLARLMGISDWAIGVTIVAAGTSLPELATALVAAQRGRMGMLAGTLVGSDLFNLLGVLGLTAFLHPLAVSHGVDASLMLMPVMVTILIVLMRTGWRLTRAEGLVLIAIGLLRWWWDLQ
ncbi:MAG: calcium/sodium antiporter [Deltaproteobacteria bacterium]|nr:calcium/sodium antiporter [Deltaproteobacteria bacterium]